MKKALLRALLRMFVNDLYDIIDDIETELKQHDELPEIFVKEKYDGFTGKTYYSYPLLDDLRNFLEKMRGALEDMQ